MAQMGSADLEEGWRYIEEHGLQPLLECLDADRDARIFRPHELMSFYQTVYNLAIAKEPRSYAADLYERIKSKMTAYLQERALTAVKELHDQFLLQELVRRWNNHKILVKWIQRHCGYLDRYYVIREERAPLIDVGYTCFKNVVFSAINEDVRTAVLTLVLQERDGQAIDVSLLKNIKDIFVEMGMGSLEVYQKELETPFLASTREFYRRESARWAEEYSFHNFIIQAEKSFETELVRTRAYLDPQTEEKVKQCCEEEILKEHQLHMLNKEKSGLVVMLEQNQVEDLRRLYNLYAPMNSGGGLKYIAQIFRKHIQKEGMTLVEHQKSKFEAAQAAEKALGKKATTETNKSDFECIESLLALHERYLNLVSECFKNNPIFRKAMKDAFEVFVNQQFGMSPTAELFANYCDSLLSQSGIGAKMDEERIEIHLDKLVMLFEHLSEKDLFQEYAQKQLAKRLLMEKSINELSERSFIQKLKYKCGSHYTTKLEGMITDINLSEDHRTKFRDWSKNNLDNRNEDDTNNDVYINGIAFRAHVLKSGHWPTYQKEELKLADPLAECIKTFTSYYDDVTEQRVLRWAHSLGKGVLETTAFEGNRNIPRLELTVSSHQMCILLQFNEVDELPYEKIRESMQVPDDDNMKQNMATLCTKKYPLLVKKQENGEDVFALNKSWSPPRRMIKMPIPTARITVEEVKAVQGAVQADRRHAIESAIVRVMKHHQVLGHQVLVANVSQLLFSVFTPEPRVIKDRIEDLISRDFLERDSEDPYIYRYLA
eukprot:Plantae.Rhodophyta-Purpureofilum_apyrenoidigerum.ctg11924.p1 GENE.Plantae.Rhodophyta-Purpureofilum_apyrenoidigerum.ctg11924~~Plantae.Rhodophyta-Purpureofilum_apyrenoidigerum.ctg11924.p1  ORF type:complete len:772 (-),score=212.21 Plantae.Rhodophyta-Purpureofilum_apyrenoidigerum.ctg11924:46-2361(-)